jgi:hypothetical protein
MCTARRAGHAVAFGVRRSAFGVLVLVLKVLVLKVLVLRVLVLVRTRRKTLRALRPPRLISPWGRWRASSSS